MSEGSASALLSVLLVLTFAYAFLPAGFLTGHRRAAARARQHASAATSAPGVPHTASAPVPTPTASPHPAAPDPAPGGPR
ncbi:hypothetical protein [Kineococcus sp. SYSU DK005]|uniref:hypothetical protein n=1 Tax=Kineococcus sp. SYSU DK005 TaxID=3383126 RepID=UPI003D7DD862